MAWLSTWDWQTPFLVSDPSVPYFEMGPRSLSMVLSCPSHWCALTVCWVKTSRKKLTGHAYFLWGRGPFGVRIRMTIHMWPLKTCSCPWQTTDLLLLCKARRNCWLFPLEKGSWHSDFSALSGSWQISKSMLLLLPQRSACEDFKLNIVFLIFLDVLVHTYIICIYCCDGWSM